MLTTTASIIIPTKDDKGENLLGEQVRYATNLIKRAFTSLFGGYTTYFAVGGWYDLEHDIFIEEPVTVIMSYTSPQGRDTVNEIHRLASEVKTLLHQTSVMYVENGVAHFAT